LIGKVLTASSATGSGSTWKQTMQLTTSSVSLTTTIGAELERAKKCRTGTGDKWI